jgi:crotonobetainyl-CoA:carnitine CoA-transferase CaiB-like acyl-CoA transferase
VDLEARARHHLELIAILEDVFAARSAAEWSEALTGSSGAWAFSQSPAHLPSDPQVIANDYLPTVERSDGARYPLAAGPVQFDETPVALEPAPAHAQHTDEILLELGRTRPEVEGLKDRGVVA